MGVEAKQEEKAFYKIGEVADLTSRVCPAILGIGIYFPQTKEEPGQTPGVFESRH